MGRAQMWAGAMSYLLILILLMPLIVMGQASDVPPKVYRSTGASAPGNFIIAGLFPIHEGIEKPFQLSQPHDPTCSSFSMAGLVQSLAMIYAIETVNNSPLLNRLGVTLGYKIHDTCSDVTTALRAIEDLTADDCSSTTGFSNMSECFQASTAVIGAYYSEISIAVARELNLELIPQVSYASTADILSDKSRFPAFSRTVPSDMHQTSAMVKLLKENKWTWVGVVSTDGDYGRSALDSFLSQAFQAGICVAFKEILPDSVTNTQRLNSAINKAVQTLHTNVKVKVVVSFAKPEHMSRLFRGLLDKGQSASDRRLWVASDNWSTSQRVLTQEQLYHIGWVVGFSFKSRDVIPFQEFLNTLEFTSEAQTNNSFLKEFYSTFTSNKEEPSMVRQKLITSADAGNVLSIEMAVNAIAQAVAKLCSNRNCTTRGAIQPWELLPELRNSTYEMGGILYTFDENGDVNLGYQVSLWNMTGQSVQTLNVVSEYHQENSSLTDTNLKLNVTSKCSDSCKPGQFKKSAEGQHTCCYDCIDCAENQYSNSTDMDQCFNCDSLSEWAEPGSLACKPKTVEFFAWNDAFAMFLLSLAALGILIVFLLSFFFLWHRDSPVVKAAGGPLCQLILFSLLGSFVSSVFFVGKPEDIQCKLRQVLYGLSFTLCVSCIMVKSLKILLVFQLKLALQRPLSRLYKPYIVICFCVLVQGANCTWWLILFSPHKTRIINTSTILEECHEGSYAAFGTVLGFIALLALICFIFAFQGRKLPEKYNEAKFITFGMLVYLMAWVIFIPVYVTTAGKYLPAVEMVVILISNYAILCCHFFPKCYAIIFRRMYNTRDDFIRNVYEYSKKSASSLGDLILPEAYSTSKGVEDLYTISSPPHFFLENVKFKPRWEPTAPPALTQKKPRGSLKRTLSI